MRLNRAIALIGLAVATVLAAAGLHPWRIDADLVAAQLNAASAPWGGAHWGRPASATFTLLPWPRLNVEEIQLADFDNMSVFNAPSATISLRALGLLNWRFAPQAVKLRRPTAAIDLEKAREETTRISSTMDAPLSRLDVADGSVTIFSGASRASVVVEHVEGWAEWAKATRPLSFSFEGQWRERRAAFAGRVESPLDLARGERTGVRLSVAANSGKLDFVGAAQDAGALNWTGDLTLQAGELRSFAQWLGIEAPSLAAQTLSLHAQASGDATTVALNDARLQMGEQTLDGTIALARRGEGYALSGTLAADRFDLDSVLKSPRSLIASNGFWSDEQLLPAPDPALDLDLRLSAAHATWGGHNIDDVAASLLQQNGRATWRVLQATASQGALNCEITIEGAGATMDTKATLAIENADLGALLGEWGVRAYSGRGSLTATLEGRGDSAARIAATLSGTARADLQAGALTGLNFEEALRRSLRRPLDLARDMAVGQTKFSAAEIRLDIEHGQAQFSKAHVSAPGAALDADGVIDIGARSLRTWIVAVQADSAGRPSAEAARQTFSWIGPWSAPVLSIVATTN